MGIKRKGSKQEKKDVVFNNLKEEEEYEGRLVYVADLGLHKNDYKGVVKPDVQKLSLGIEIIGETIEVDGEVKPRLMWTKPFNIYYSLTDKGAELAQYKIFNPSAKAGEVADWDSVLDTPVNVTIVNVKSKDGDEVYDNIDSLIPIPKKYQKSVGKATIKPCIGDSEDENNEATKALHSLARWMWDQRIVEEDTNSVGDDFHSEDEIPF